MRTDVKIGIVLGLLVIAGIVAYFFILSGGEDPRDTGSGPGQVADASGDKGPELGRTGDTTPLPKPPAEPPVDPLAPLTPGVPLPPATPPGPAVVLDPGSTPPVIPLPATPGVETPGTEVPGPPTVTPDPTEPLPLVPIAVEPGRRPGDPGAPTEASGAPRPEFSPGPEPVGPTIPAPVIPTAPIDPGPAVAVLPPPGAEDPGLVTPTDPLAPLPGVAEPVTPSAAPPFAPLGTTPSEYKIQPGDRMWKIAEKVYAGKGYLWSLIAKANPQMDPNNLRVGSILKIPPAPAPTERPGGGAVEPVLAPGQGTLYVVKSGDKGFWEIAEKSYGPGKGHLWPRIAEANPKVKPSSLRPGQKLVIPPMPTATPPAGGGAIAVNPLAVPAGAGTYRVEKGDTLQGISLKKFGTTRHWTKIKDANPTINPTALRIGQMLVIPDVSGAAAPPLPRVEPAPRVREFEPAPLVIDSPAAPVRPAPAPAPASPEPPRRGRHLRPDFGT